MPPRKPELAPPERALDAAPQGEDVRYDRALRPQTLDDYIGQSKHKDNLRVFVEAARRRGEPLDHLLLCGPPGLGKTTLAQILAHEMGVELHIDERARRRAQGRARGPPHEARASDDVLFIDEIHRL